MIWLASFINLNTGFVIHFLPDINGFDFILSSDNTGFVIHFLSEINGYALTLSSDNTGFVHFTKLFTATFSCPQKWATENWRLWLSITWHEKETEVAKDEKIMSIAAFWGPKKGQSLGFFYKIKLQHFCRFFWDTKFELLV